jgi:hypothetical protein
MKLKRLARVALFVLFCFAGATVASAERVSWIPTTVSEITNYAKAEFNSIHVYLCTPAEDGGYTYVEINRPCIFWRMSSSWDVEAVTTNELRKYINYFLTNNDGYSTPPKEGQVYFVEGQWIAFYNDDGGNDIYGWNLGVNVRSRSPQFTFPKVDGKFVIPPEAFDLTPDWLANSCVVPAVAAHPRWVDYFLHQSPPYGDWFEQTRNGRHLDCPGSGPNGFIYLNSGFINQAVIMPGVFPDAYSTITIWYDESRTDGTEWRWDETGVHKREILPPIPPRPKLAISPETESCVRLTLSGAQPGGSYTIEGSSNFLDWNSVATVVAGTNGIGECLVSKGGSIGAKQFFRAVSQ